MKMVPVIMAGGTGERFWPKSRQRLPKQFLNLLGNQSMLELTVKRLEKIAPLTDIHIVTRKEYAALVKKQIPDLPDSNIILEPVGKNTAPCIGLAATVLARRYGTDTVMIVVPSDHMIMNEERYLDIIRAAAEPAQRPGRPMITIGVFPSRPETAYGYIKVGPNEGKIAENHVFLVDQFVEKPDMKKAAQYIQSGQYLWNSGIFIFRIDSILSNMEEHLPELAGALKRIQQAFDTIHFSEVLTSEYTSLNPISIDYGIMEKADQVLVIPGDFGWDDLGSWTCMERLNPPGDDQNIIRGNVISLDNRGCIVEAGSYQRLIAILGADNLIVVDTEDATLICPKDRAQDIKRILENLKIRRQEQYL
jgi:Mannose-1-phosphate guanylyltransferase